MIPKYLAKKNDKLFNKLIPLQGKCKTVEGEMLRAINKIIYRYYNDGDYWYKGYGMETVGSAQRFLRKFAPIELIPELKVSYCTTGKNYEKQLIIILKKIITYIESRTRFDENDQDMLNC